MAEQLDSGSWGLFSGQGGRQIVLIDDEPCGPSSARKYTRRIPRELLLDENRIAKAVQSGEDMTETVRHADREWIVALRPMHSPRSASVVGVFAGVFPVDVEVPALPKVGGWEWEIELDGEGQPTSNRRTYWNRGLYDIYEVDPDTDQQSLGYWETGQWANELIERSDQMRVNSLVRDGIQEGLTGVGKMGVTGTLRCLTYNIVTGYGTESRGSRHLRLVGQIVPVQPGDEKILIQGFSYEVPDTFHDMAFVHDVNAGRVDDVLRGVMSLVNEPMAVIDVETLELLTTSASWRDAGFGHVGGFREVVMGDEEELHSFVRGAWDEINGPCTKTVNLQRTDGVVETVEMSAVGVKSGVQSKDVVVRIDLNDEAGRQ